MMIRILVIFIIAGTLFSSCTNLKTSDKGESSEVEITDSVAILTEMIRNDSSDYKLFMSRSQKWLERGQLDRALRDISYTIERNNTDPEVFIYLGDLYFIMGKKENCINSYLKALKLDTESSKSKLKLAETYLIWREYDKAENFIELTTSTDAENPKAYFLKGVLLMETGDTTNALLNLKIAGNLDTTYYEAFMQTGSIYLALHDTTAADFFNAALRSLPDNEQALFLLGVAYQTMEHFEKAEEVYRKVNSLYPDNEQAIFNLGYILMVEKLDFDGAIEAFNKVLMINPSSADAVYNLGRISEEKGEYDIAREYYNQAKELKVNYPLAIEGLNRLDHLGH